MELKTRPQKVMTRVYTSAVSVENRGCWLSGKLWILEQYHQSPRALIPIFCIIVCASLVP